jgi:hypothetical protein
MEATRPRVTSILEWAVAVAFIAAMLVVGSVVVREFRLVSAMTSVSASAPDTVPPTLASVGVPPRAISVPMLLLSDGKEVRVGETISVIVERLGEHAIVGKQAIERAVHGQRVTRFYDHVGTQFVLVFEPFEENAEPRVAAIYLQ